MYMLIAYPVGIIVEAVVLAHGRKRLRVAAAGFPDVLELKRSRNGWSTDSGQNVEIAFMMSSAQQSESASSSEPALLTRAIGAQIAN